MEVYFWYVGFGIIGVLYLFSVIYCAFDDFCQEWWEPWALGAIYPFLWLYLKREEIAGWIMTLLFLVIFVWLVVMLVDLVQWIGGLL